jgi:hypothetical protein
MEFAPQSSPNQPEVSRLEKGFDIPHEISLPFQTKLFATYLTNQEGKMIAMDDLDDETVSWFAQRYGAAFHDYCLAHPEISKKIIDSNGDIGSLSEVEKDTMVLYIKMHPEDKAIKPTFH